MKNKSFFLITVITAMALVSCEKEETVFNPDSNSSLTFSKAGPGFHRNYFDNGKHPGVEGEDYGCELVPGDCMNDVLIMDGEIWESLGGLGSLIFSLDGGQGDIITTLKDNKEAFSSVFPENLIDDTIDGTLVLSARGTLSEESTIYFLFKNKDGEIVTTVPVKQ